MSYAQGRGEGPSSALSAQRYQQYHAKLQMLANAGVAAGVAAAFAAGLLNLSGDTVSGAAMQTAVTALDPDSAAYQGALGDVLQLLGPDMSAVINVAFRQLLLMCFFEARPQGGLIRAEESPSPLAEEGACDAAVAHVGAWAALLVSRSEWDTGDELREFAKLLIASETRGTAAGSCLTGTNSFSKNQLHMLKDCAVDHLVEVSPCLA